MSETPRQSSHSSDQDSTYCLYVVRLKNFVARFRKMRIANPNYVERKPVVYVGMTKQAIEDRIAQHLRGGMFANRYVNKFMRRIFYSEFEHLPCYETKEEAERAERELAESYRARGWAVWQN